MAMDVARINDNGNKVVDGMDTVRLEDQFRYKEIPVNDYVLYGEKGERIDYIDTKGHIRFDPDGTPENKLKRLSSVSQVGAKGQAASNYVSGRLALKASELNERFFEWKVEKVALDHKGAINNNTPMVTPDGKRTTVGEYVKGDIRRLHSVLSAAGKGGKEFGVHREVLEVAQPPKG